MARYRLASVFKDQYKRNYIFLASPNPSSECFICKTPYSPNDAEGCRAIQLIPCGHIIGHECLLEWTSRFPRACPYWSHNLPRTLKAWTLNQSLEVVILRWLVESLWITAMDDVVQGFVPSLKDRKQRRVTRKAVKALVMGTLSRKKVDVLTKWVACLVFRESFMHGFVYLPVEVAGILCCF